MDVFEFIEQALERTLHSFAGLNYEVKTGEKKMISPTVVVFSVTLAQAKGIMPRQQESKLAQYLPFINSAMHEFEINTPDRAAAFLAQLAHESGELRYMEEIADGHAYEGRKDLGNVNPGDGKRYKGRGPIQLTGRINYKTFGGMLGLDLENNPQIAATPEVGFRIAACFWKTHGLNELADLGSFKDITRKINGGFNGLEERTKYYELAKKILKAND